MIFFKQLIVLEARSFRLLISLVFISTLDSGIDVAHGINVAPGTFGKNIKHSP